jgi:hypothetical protein
MAARGPYRTPDSIGLEDEQAVERAIERLIAESQRERGRRRGRRAMAWERPAVALLVLVTVAVAGLGGVLMVALAVALMGAVTAVISVGSG